jgi:DNA-binding response OmpR family regulator
MAGTVKNILLADDNQSEHIFFVHSLRFINESINLQSVSGGPSLMQYLNDVCNQIPDILFLDINMPIKDGKECLADLRADKRFDHMSIVMYSTSDDQSDTDETYGLGADRYVRKPVEIDDLISMLRTIISAYEQGAIKPSCREQYVLASSTI